MGLEPLAKRGEVIRGTWGIVQDATGITAPLLPIPVRQSMMRRLSGGTEVCPMMFRLAPITRAPISCRLPHSCTIGPI